MRYYLHTLGCAKNIADSDGLGALLAQHGLTRAETSADADVLIVNTCGFLQAARRESLDALRALGEHKRADQFLIAIGCLISRYGETIRRAAPQVDAVLDAGEWLALPRVIEQRAGDWRAAPYNAVATARSIVTALPRGAQGPSAYLKIADGCDRPCAFCVIPAIKGAPRSKPADAVIAEARELVAHGARELILVAQDTTAYGWDWGERDALASLIERLCREVDGLEWLRLMYTFPGHITPRLIETLARYPQVAHYIDVPLQHAHPETLKRMKRPSLTVTREMLRALRAALPDLAIRTTFIVGFPGETEEEFRALLEFLEEQQFDRVGVFEFSREEGTLAAALPDQVPRRIKKYRRERAMALQQKISLAKHRAWIGKELVALVEGTGAGVSLARSYRDAPEVDGIVLIQKELPIGTFARVKITQALEYDLIGEVQSSKSNLEPRTWNLNTEQIMANPQLNFDFVEIPAGEFIIGTTPGRGVDIEPDETPRHELTLPAFFIARFPVTNAQYAAFITATGHRAPKFWRDGKMPDGKADHPVVGVNFHDCLAFCKWASQVLQLPIRLPLEPEWEKAARGTDGRVYPWGNQWEARRANTFESKLNGTTPVTRYASEGASPYGIADLVGNVSEWCFSMFSKYPYRADDGRERLELAEGQHLPWVERWGLQVTNEPSRLRGNEQRVTRGGSFRGTKAICRCAYRGWAAAIHLSDDTGFRVAYRK